MLSCDTCRTRLSCLCDMSRGTCDVSQPFGKPLCCCLFAGMPGRTSRRGLRAAALSASMLQSAAISAVLCVTHPVSKSSWINRASSFTKTLAEKSVVYACLPLPLTIAPKTVPCCRWRSSLQLWAFALRFFDETPPLHQQPTCASGFAAASSIP